MKNSIVLKFIAIVLCAACLLGTVGGLAGVAVLSSGDLYNQTVDELIDERIRLDAMNFADSLALEFAGRELGSCPEGLLQERYHSNYWFSTTYPEYGYTILDENGSVLAAYREELKDQVGDSYSIPVSGQYMHLVSTESQEKFDARQNQLPEVSGDGSFEVDSELLQAHVKDVYALTATFPDGGELCLEQGNNPVGQLIYWQNEDFFEFIAYENVPYTSVMMQDVVKLQCFDGNGRKILYMESSEGVGSFRFEDHEVKFTTVSLEELTAPVPEVREGMLTDLDGEVVPENGTSVHNVVFSRSDGSVIYEGYCYGGNGSYTFYYDGGNGSASGIPANNAGFLFYNSQGQLVFHSTLGEGERPASSLVYGMHFQNFDTNFTFQTQDPSGLGTLSLVDNNLVFTSYARFPDATSESEPPAEETVPVETTEVTLPEETAAATDAAEAVEETQAETIPETTESETIPFTEETIPSSASAIPEETFAEPQPEATEAVEATEAAEASQQATEPIPVETIPQETIPAETVPETTEPVIINGKPLEDYQINKLQYYDSDTGGNRIASYVYVPMPELTVELYIDRDSMEDQVAYNVLRFVRQYRDYLLPLAGVCLFLCAVFAVYLCTAAGRKPKCEEVRAGGLNRIPLDLYLFGGGFLIALIYLIAFEGPVEILLRQDALLGCSAAVALAYLCCLIFVGFCFAMVAQFKTPGGFWWRNTLCGICIRGFMKFGVWLETFLSRKGFPWLVRWCKKLWSITKAFCVWLYRTAEAAVLWLGEKIAVGLRWFGRKFRRFIALLPMTWQWLLGGFAVIFLAALCINDYNSPNVVLLGLAACLAIVLYGTHCFGVLSESTKRMSKGDLDTKVEDKLMVGCFEEFANDLNALADVAVVAAQKQLKSERMKTELITNVSHDIKTPLTSIINYVDLLQKPHTDEEQEQYLEVLDRQSQQLKKLINDLMDMSKASTGNMSVEITTVDAIESVNQALGEFADKLDKAGLIPVFRHSEDRAPMLADGKLVWRVMSNLLSNAVKYALPGTRLYIDLMVMEGKVVISMKNISREELNIDADELMERFVRGDDSRNTEGSGLGLNIAKSLMELQKGQLQLLVDGDLFKVTLIFPGA